MLVTNIKKLLEMGIDPKKRPTAFLIDGPWGCGKTFNVKEAIDEKGDSTYAYISLFGLNSVSEIALRLGAFLDARFISNIHNQYFIQSPLAPKDSNGSLLIFDDLERAGQSLHFEEVFGVINSLRDLGFSIVCLVNLAEIKERERFIRLADKVFDDLIQVEADPKVFAEIVGGIDAEYGDSLLEMAKNNWRVLIKTEDWYKKACDQIATIQPDASLGGIKTDSYAFVASVLCAVLCVFSSNQQPPTFEGSNPFSKIHYETLASKFGVFTANELYRLSAQEKAVTSTNRDLVEVLIECILENDFQALLNRYFPKPQDSILTKPPFNQAPYLLGDEGKRVLKSSFLGRLSDFDFSQDYQERYLVSFLSVFLNELTEQEMKTIIGRIMESIPEKEQGDFARMLFFDKPKEGSNAALFEKMLEESFEKERKDTEDKRLSALIGGRDYTSLVDYLDENRYAIEKKKERIAEAFAADDYCLPDLSKTLTHETWVYSLEIARFLAFSEDQKNRFISYLKELCKISSSKTLRHRCHVLVKNGFNEDIDFETEPKVK